MKSFSSVVNFFKKIFYYPKWRCVNCGKEIFNDEYFCDTCKNELPFIEGAICEHCGRKTIADEKYCSTCKGRLIFTDKARSVFNYQKPVDALIRKAKYDNKRYLLDMFAEHLANAYFKNYFNADYLCFVPMTKKREKNRGYNQSKILAEKLSQKTGVPVFYEVEKIKDTQNQAKLSAEARRKNLTDAFKVIDKKTITGKKILIIDDVTTTGATAEAVATKLKKAGATIVELLTVASVPPKDGY